MTDDEYARIREYANGHAHGGLLVGVNITVDRSIDSPLIEDGRGIRLSPGDLSDLERRLKAERMDSVPLI